MRASGLLFVLLTVLFTGCAVNAQTSVEKVYGDWYGESKCVGTNPYCKDEVVVYHLKRSDTDPAKVNLTADKIVNKKPETMGAFDCIYDPAKQTLRAEFKIPRTGGTGVWLFTVKGETMDGTLTVFPENEIGRRVKVSRTKPKEY